MEQLTKNQAVATSQEAVQNQNEPQLRDENAHNDKSVHGVLNPTYQAGLRRDAVRSEERFSRNAETDLVCRLLLEKKKKRQNTHTPSESRVALILQRLNTYSIYGEELRRSPLTGVGIVLS